MFVDSIFHEDRSVVSDLMSANYTFVNERLAAHYNIPDIRGDHFRRVTLIPTRNRFGLLGKGAILTGDRLSQSHFAGFARSVHSRKRYRHAALAAAAECTGFQGKQRG